MAQVWNSNKLELIFLIKREIIRVFPVYVLSSCYNFPKVIQFCFLFLKTKLLLFPHCLGLLLLNLFVLKWKGELLRELLLFRINSKRRTSKIYFKKLQVDGLSISFVIRQNKLPDFRNTQKIFQGIPYPTNVVSCNFQELRERQDLLYFLALFYFLTLPWHFKWGKNKNLSVVMIFY